MDNVDTLESSYIVGKLVWKMINENIRGTANYLLFINFMTN